MTDYANRMRLLAIDPGPTWMGWALLDVQYGPGVRTTFLEGGHAPCDFEAFRRTLTGASNYGHHCDGTPDPCDPDRTELAMVVETPAGFAFQPGRVPMLLQTAVAAGGMAWLGRSRGMRVVQATAQQVRKVLAGKSNADDGVVKDVVLRQVFGAAGATNDHVRDAVAVGLLGAWVLVGQVVLPETATKAKKKGDRNGAGGKKANDGKRGPRAAGPGA